MAHRGALALRPLAVVMALWGLSQSAAAFQLDTGRDDLQIYWDNTLTLNLGWRVDSIDSKLGDDPNAHQSDYKFPDRGDMWQKRLDWRSELDVIYKKNFGFRISTAAWYDNAYDDHEYASNPAVAVLSRTGKYDSNTKRFYNGPSGELLDAFVFGSFELGEGRSLSLRLGRHALVWGVSQVSLGEAISWGQQPMDLRKQAEVPGVSPKEVAMPLNQFSFQSNVADGVSVSGYYQLDWAENRLSEGGTFLGSTDFLWEGDAKLSGVIPHTGQYKPDSGKRNGNFGLQLELSPDWMMGSISLIYRKFDEKQPWAVLFDDAMYSGFHQSYARGVEILGASANTVLGGASAGFEVHYRKGGALASAAGVGRDGPTGDTWHLLANAQKMIGTSGLWESAVLVAELGYSRLVKVRTRPDLYNGSGYACSGGVDAGCATRDSVTASLIFQPTWTAVWPGVDLTGNFVVANYGVKGNTPNLIGGKERSYSYLLGVTADVNKSYKVTLQYADSGARRPEVTTDRGRLNLSLTKTF